MRETHGYLSLTPPLALAVREGRKTQTMRPMRVQPLSGAAWWEHLRGRTWEAHYHGPWSGHTTTHRAPHAPGDVLWVREGAMVMGYSLCGTRATVQYDVDGVSRKVPWPARLRPLPVGRRIPNGCHREAARTYVRVLSVEPRRLQSITEEEARAEGCEPHDGSVCVGETCRASFRVLWDSLYRRKGLGWDADPWVWCVRFERVEVPHG